MIEINNKKLVNEVELDFLAISENERLARMIASAFIVDLNPSIDEMQDIKTAVSEAVTNCIVHGYDKEKYKCDEGIVPKVHMYMSSVGRLLTIKIEDFGIGIEDIEKAKEPLYTTKPEQERTGMGFVFMDVFMDSLEVFSEIDKGTKIIMKKYIASGMDNK